MRKMVETCIYSRTRLLVWGLPGVGKTSIINRIAADMGRRCWTLIASYREPSDFGGLPVVGQAIKVDGQEFSAVELAPPRFAVEAANDPNGGVLFIDEITTTPPAVQAPLLRLIQEGMVGELLLPGKKVAIIAAANPPDIAANGYELKAPLANRFVHIDFVLNHADWIEAFPSYWGAPPDTEVWGKKLDEEKWAQKRALIASWIRNKAGALHDMPKDTIGQGRAWPSPRSWDNLSRILTVADSVGLAKGELHQLGCGCVGDGHGREFFTWAEALDLPNPEMLLANPDKLILPDRGDQQFAILASVAAAVTSRNNDERWVAGWNVMIRAAKLKAPDIAAAAAVSLANNRPKKSNVTLPREAGVVFGGMFNAVVNANKLESK